MFFQTKSTAEHTLDHMTQQPKETCQRTCRGPKTFFTGMLTISKKMKTFLTLKYLINEYTRLTI